MFHVSTSPSAQDFFVPKASPLTPRDPNACPRFSVQMAGIRAAGGEDKKYSYRRAYNPLFQRKAGDGRDHRRQVFLKKVKKDGDDRIWESRSEQILRQDFIAKQRQWEIEQARTAPEAPPSFEEEHDDKTTPSQEIDSVDRLLSQEDQSIEELVSLMEHTERDGEDEYQRHAQDDYGSDEDDYDLLFREVLSQDETVDGGARYTHTYTAEATPGRNQDHEMDVSVG